MQLTDNNIEFDWYETGSIGSRFMLYPKRGIHSEVDVKKARTWLYHNHAVMSIQIRWKLADDTTEPPERVPDSIIIRELRVELGKQKAYSEELEDKIKSNNSKLKADMNEGLQKERSEERKNVHKEELYMKIKSENSKLKREVVNLRESISELVNKLVKQESK